MKWEVLSFHYWLVELMTTLSDFKIERDVNSCMGLCILLVVFLCV